MNISPLSTRYRRLPSLVYSLSRCAHTSSQNDNLALFREINRLASEGKWDNINNAPKIFSLKSNRDAYAVYRKLVCDEKEYFKRTPYGQLLKAVWRISLFIGGVWAAVYVYELLVPEEHRLHYKYRNKHEHPVEEHH